MLSRHTLQYFAAYTSLALPVAAFTSAKSEPSDPPCIQYWGEARFRALGYDHIVHIRNACPTEARCEVTTDVSPKPVQTVVPAGQEAEVVTFLGSPAREFTPTARCTLL